MREIYYGPTARGSVGMRAVYELLRDEPIQSTPDRITWRHTRAFVAGQSSNTRFRRAKTQNRKKAGIRSAPVFAAQIEVDFLDTGLEKDGKYRYIMVCIDVFTRFVFLATFAGASVDASRAGRLFNGIADDIKIMFGGGWPYVDKLTVLKADNGPEHGAEFAEIVQEHTPELRVKRGLPNNPNSQALAENAVGRVRTRLRGMRPTLGKRWSTYLDDVAAGLNQTKQEPLGYNSPADMLQATIRRSAEDMALLDAVKKQQTGRAKRARGVTRTEERPVAVGARVRLLDLAYVKRGKNRPNAMKFGPRWSKVYTITQRRATGNNTYAYRVSKPGDDNWRSVSQIQVVTGDQALPDERVLRAAVDYPVFRIIDKRGRDEYLTLYEGYPTAEWARGRDLPPGAVATFESGAA